MEGDSPPTSPETPGRDKKRRSGLTGLLRNSRSLTSSTGSAGSPKSSTNSRRSTASKVDLPDHDEEEDEEGKSLSDFVGLTTPSPILKEEPLLAKVSSNVFDKRNSSINLTTSPSKDAVGDPSGTPQMYVRMLLRVEPSSIVIQPLSVSEGMQSRTLVINRIDYGLHTISSNGQVSGEGSITSPESTTHMPVNTQVEIIFGVLGIIPLLSGRHLIVITKRNRVGSILGRDIFKIVETRIVTVSVDDTHLREEEKREEKEYLSLLSQFLESSNFYFSYNYDVTHTLQRISAFSEEEMREPLWKRVDERFFWNKFICSDLIQNNLHEWILPVMDGFFSLSTVEILSEQITYALISRRTGARYHTRGADPSGRTANFVESEQILINRGNASSYVEIRGSIPCIWHQISKEYKPKPKPEYSAFSMQSLRLHFEELNQLYGPVVVVNLVDRLGIEADLGDHFETLVKLYNNENVKYIAFDFHVKCKNNRYDQMSTLLEEISPLLDSHRYYLQDTNGRPIIQQKGIIRTNCIDCLDRTNVVQTLFAKYQLRTQFAHLGIAADPDEYNEIFGKFYVVFQNAWADNADVMSEQYTGTGALKNDFTRTGKRSVKGMATDGLNSMKRYINKTFQYDEQRQMSVDVFLGKFSVGKFDFMSVDGVYFYESYLIDEYQSMDWRHRNFTEENGMKTHLIVDTRSGNITEFSTESGERTVFPFSSIKHMERSNFNSKLFSVLYQSNSTRRFYLCKRMEDRQECYDRIHTEYAKHNPEYAASGALVEPAGVFYATWNMRYNTEPPSEAIMEQWIPKTQRHDIIAVAVQNCVYNVPDEFQSIHRPDHHLFYLVQKHLGRDYQCIMTSTSNNGSKEADMNEIRSKMETGTLQTTHLIVLVHADVYHKVSNVNASKIHYRIREKPNNDILSFSKIRSKLMPQSKSSTNVSTTDHSRTIGTAVHFNVMDTPVCFVDLNHSHDMPSDALMCMKGQLKMDVDFQYIFMSGCINSMLISERYHQLYSTHVTPRKVSKGKTGQSALSLDDLNDNNHHLYGSAYCKIRCMASEFQLGQIQLGPPASIDAKPSIYNSFYTQFKISTLRAPSSIEGKGTTIIQISNLKLTDLSNLVAGRGDVGLTFYNALLLSEGRLPPQKKLEWSKFQIPCVFDNAEYQEKSCVNVLVDFKDTTVMGTGVIPLEGSHGKSTEFLMDVTCDDEYVCKISGTLLILPSPKK
ncbi:hypothetical protein PROFUN_00805 [Planoprotostelium fungivorum]|uniref:phosphoinositide 5-phosphatase n=1 Tax=Planoprotostelium fungivorum TaxID=1890364 RepID=A0A2P6P005_9EUKA|nr:hypothetical protein PROFUN_00805 [Planoprotostelium fungivorum]